MIARREPEREPVVRLLDWEGKPLTGERLEAARQRVIAAHARMEARVRDYGITGATRAERGGQS